MTHEEIIKITNSFLVEEFEVDESKISAEGNLKETLDLDSLDYVDLVVVIESNFGFKVKNDDFINIVTFHDFYNYCHAKVQEKAVA